MKKEEVKTIRIIKLYLNKKVSSCNCFIIGAGKKFSENNKTLVRNKAISIEKLIGFDIISNILLTAFIN